MRIGEVDSLPPVPQVKSVQPTLTKPTKGETPSPETSGGNPNETNQALKVTADPNQQVSKAKVVKAVEQANKTMETFQTNLCFKIHEETKEYYVQVINSDTKEVIREIPSKKMLDMVADMEKMLGWIVDKFV